MNILFRSILGIGLLIQGFTHNVTNVYTKEKLGKISDLKNNETVYEYTEILKHNIIKSAYNGSKNYYWKDDNYEFSKVMIQSLIIELKKTFIDVKFNDGLSVNGFSILVDWN
jgi:hypothetical protein